MLAQIHTLALRYALIAAGIVIGAVSLTVFLQPLDIAPAGVAGASTLLNELYDTPVGLVIFLLNIPIQLLGYIMLPNGSRVILRSVIIVLVFSVVVDNLRLWLPPTGISDERMLNALFGGITGGIGVGLVYRAGATMGGTSTLALILQRRLGFPMSTTFICTDTLIILSAGLVYGWEGALYAAIALFTAGLATDYVLEGPSVIRTAMIITDKPEDVSQRVFANLQRGVTSWTIKGEYTGAERTMLYITIARSQVRDLKDEVAQVDPNAFIVIGMGHAAYGAGFRRMKGPRM
ncbi:MAG: YitT family protein [Chloroflexota bacterium]|nr:YitT family protein [Chloroflexota bacterium]MDE2909943.1 YitT family protein [Chloroflexota bacterium]